MTKRSPRRPSISPQAEAEHAARKERESEQLRENLLKRKEQARARRDEDEVAAAEKSAAKAEAAKAEVARLGAVAAAKAGSAKPRSS